MGSTSVSGTATYCSLEGDGARLLAEIIVVTTNYFLLYFFYTVAPLPFYACYNSCSRDGIITSFEAGYLGSGFSCCLLFMRDGREFYKAGRTDIVLSDILFGVVRYGMRMGEFSGTALGQLFTFLSGMRLKVLECIMDEGGVRFALLFGAV